MIPPRQELAIAALSDLEAWGAARDWSGTDPYEGLNATRFVGPMRRSAFGRQLIIQAVKRSPVNLRPLLGIPEAHNSMATAAALSSYCRNEFLDQTVASAGLDRTLQTLQDLRCSDYEEPCWGYHFDVQTRALFYPKGAPNTIATSFAAMALLDVYDRTREPQLLEMAIGAGDFFLRHVPQTKTDQGAFFGYFVGDRTPIHNASMLVAGLLARLHGYSNRSDFYSAAEQAIHYCAAHQRSDGSWPYGELDCFGWIDNFHTGYVLESLMIALDHGIGDSSTLEWGLNYYEQTMFREDWAPKYTNRSVYPVDCQCVAQAIQTFSLAAKRYPQYREQAWAVFEYAVREMQRKDGAFIFQKRRFWSNKMPHMRWVVTPMMLALTHLLTLAKDGGPSK